MGQRQFTVLHCHLFTSPSLSNWWGFQKLHLPALHTRLCSVSRHIHIWKVAPRMCLGKERTDLVCIIPAQPLEICLWLPNFSWPWRMDREVQLQICSNSHTSELCMLAQCDRRIKRISHPQGKGFSFYVETSKIKS